MKYNKLSVKLSPIDETTSVLLQDYLGGLGFECFMDTEDGFEGYVQTTVCPKETIETLMGGFEKPVEDVEMTWEATDAPDENWNAEWEKNNFTPIDIDGRCVIRSTEHEARPDAEWEILIDPELAFGTGHHETTRMITRWLMDHEEAGQSVLDMGCGTGILGILAAKKGAKSVLGIDIDEWSVRNTEKNCELNNVTTMTARLGDAELLKEYEGAFDLVIANINRNILVRDMPLYVNTLRSNEKAGALIMSGYYTEDAEIIRSRAEELGMRLTWKADENNWQVMAFETA